jgi:hypothetical protein
MALRGRSVRENIPLDGTIPRGDRDIDPSGAVSIPKERQAVPDVAEVRKIKKYVQRLRERIVTVSGRAGSQRIVHGRMPGIFEGSGFGAAAVHADGIALVFDGACGQ